MSGLGNDTLIPLSIQYLAALMDVISAEYIISSATYKQCPPPDKPEYAFIGRSNVGKSSLINMLTNKKNLAKTSSTPGKTQLINHFEIMSGDKKKWMIVDLPGYGFATNKTTTRFLSDKIDLILRLVIPCKISIIFNN